jgi:hypothetical protein
MHSFHGEKSLKQLGAAGALDAVLKHWVMKVSLKRRLTNGSHWAHRPFDGSFEIVQLNGFDEML